MFGGAKSPRLLLDWLRGLPVAPRRSSRHAQRGFLNVGAMRGVLGSSWSPRDWFRRSEPGFHFEAVDPANQGATITMYQDSAFTTPVTAVEQAVGGVLDRSRGLARGAELWADASVTLTGESTKVSTGVYRVYSSAGAASAVNVPSTLVSGKWYEVTLTIDSIATAGTGIKLASTAGTPTWTTTGAKRAMMLANATSASITINSAVATDFQVSAVSFKLVDGAHATQSVSASRPVLSQRYNLLTKSEQFDDAAWSLNATAITRTANTTTAPNNTLTADSLLGDGTNSVHYCGQAYTFSATSTYKFSFYAKANGVNYVQVLLVGGAGFANFDITSGAGAVGTSAAPLSNLAIADAGDGWFLCSVDIVNPAHANIYFSLSNSASAVRAAASFATSAGIYLWGADLRLTIDTTKGMPAYQRVNTSTDYDTAGFLPYFKFDGFDDSWQTAAIDFTSTDKVTLVAGLTKLSDTAGALLMELSANSTTTAGAFAFIVPQGGGADLAFRSAGTSATVATSGAYAAPTTRVITGIGDISGDVTRIRVDGAALAETLTDQGTGTYGNHALNIGRRNNASAPFNGRLSALIGRGAASNDGQIIKAERYSQRRTGASF